MSDRRAIASKDDLHSFIRSLNTEICRVWEHWNVLKGIHQSSNDYWLEMNESGQFWRIVSRALQDLVLVRLAAALDPKDDVVSMPNFLRLLKQQTDPNTSVMLLTQLTVDTLQIDDDMKSVDKDEPVISKIRKLRNKIVAHRDMSIVVRDAIHELPDLPDAEIEELITRLHQMIAKYCPVVGVNLIVLNFPGDDDYRAAFKLLRLGFASAYEPKPLLGLGS